MGELFIGIVGGFLIGILAWLPRKLGKGSPPAPDLAQPGRKVIVANIEEEVAEVVETVSKPNAEATLADLLNQELK